MKSNQHTAITQERNHQLAKYCAAGAGAAVLVGAVTTADAAVVFINFNNQVFIDSVDNDGESQTFTSGTAGAFDFNKDGTIDFQLRQRNNSSSYLSGNAARIAAPNMGTLRVIGKVFSTGVLYPSRLAANTLIGPAATFGTLTNGANGYMAGGLNGYPHSNWVSSAGPSSGYLGISFAANGNTYYGWIGLSVAAKNATVPYAITLSGIAYDNTPNTAILAGAVPEPGSLSLVALGGVGLAAYRRRRTAQKAAVSEAK